MLMNNSEYFNILADVKKRIKSIQYKAVLGANKELIMLYWNIGNIIIENSTWGNKFLENLAMDIKLEFPHVKGFSVRNLTYMKRFSQINPDFAIVQTVSAQLTWSHNIMLIDKLKDPDQMAWYAKMAIQNGWSLNVMEHQIALQLYQRQVTNKKIQNFDQVLSLPQSELAIQTMKDPYVFDFIEYRENLLESEIEKALIKNITNMLLELGIGFAFVGNQYHLEVAGEDFYLDLLFYHLKLRCYFVIELKTGKFIPEYAGKMNFYLSAVDDLVKSKTDNPTIGLIMCRDKNKLIAEYALKDMTKPIGVSEYKFIQELPIEFEEILPSIKDIETRITIKEESI